LIDVNLQCEQMEIEPVRNKVNGNDENEIRDVVDQVIEKCNGKNLTENKFLQVNGTVNKSNFSIQFDDSASKEILKANENKIDEKEKIDSDDLKKHVEEEQIFESEDELPPSSPIY